MTTKAEFVAQARKYLRFRHRHQGRAHLGGHHSQARVDCIGLLVCAGEDLGLVDVAGVPFRRNDELNYGPQPTRDDVHEACKRRLIVKAEAPEVAILPAPGDVITLLVKYRENEPGVTCHIAIVTQLGTGLGMLHVSPLLGVVEHSLVPKWIRRIEGIFAVPGVS